MTGKIVLKLKEVTLNFSMKIKSFVFRLFIVTALGWMLPSGFAATTNIVKIGNYFFNATNITINVGDSITWSNTSLTAHDTTQQTNLWNSPQLAQGATFTFKFTNAGYYPYICALHIVSHPEQTGTVSVVTAPNLPPTVLITNPPDGTVFTAPASVTIQASASDSDGSVTNVQFLVGSTVISNRTAAPYAATTNGLPAGNYTLTAIASDNIGAKATNSVSIIVNNLPTVAITNPVPNASFQVPATFAIGASASDSDGTVTNVQFSVNGSVIGNDTTSPYSATASSLTAGNYTLAAVASDNLGGKATNSISISVTNPPPTAVTILNPVFNGSSFSFSFATQVGYTYSGQVTPSLNPISWFTFTNLSGNGSVVQVTDSPLANSTRYYRVKAQ